jgi:hypothetical protein
MRESENKFTDWPQGRAKLPFNELRATDDPRDDKVPLHIHNGASIFIFPVWIERLKNWMAWWWPIALNGIQGEVRKVFATT